MAGLALFSLLGTMCFGADLQSLRGRLRRFFPLFVAVILIHMAFVQTGTPLLVIGDYKLITTDGVRRGAITLLRFFVILCSAAVMAAENSRRVLAALGKLKIPYLFSFMLMIALRFIPSFSASFSDSLLALQLRGVELKKIPLRKKLRMYRDLLLPVVADSVVKSRVLAIVMEARGFGSLGKRTSYLDVSMTPSDWVLTGALFGLTIAAFGIYYLTI
jgi:energy-coupling factor transport system permease protein